MSKNYLEVEVQKILEVAEIHCNETYMKSLGIFYHSWQYDTTMDKLAKVWVQEFDQKTKFQLYYEVLRHYEEAICAMERKCSVLS